MLNACSLTTTKGYLEKAIDKKSILNNYFSNIKIDYLYKAKINIYNKDFGGILIIKKIGTRHHRIVFTTEFGNKMFDFEIIEDKLKINYIISNLDKSIIINTLYNDFKTLVLEYVAVNKQFDSKLEHVYQSNDNYYFVNKKTDQLEKIINTSKNKEKLIINFLDIKKNTASKIMLKHNNFNLKINLTSINK